MAATLTSQFLPSLASRIKQSWDTRTVTAGAAPRPYRRTAGHVRATHQRGFLVAVAVHVRACVRRWPQDGTDPGMRAAQCRRARGPTPLFRIEGRGQARVARTRRHPRRGGEGGAYGAAERAFAVTPSPRSQRSQRSLLCPEGRLVVRAVGPGRSLFW